MRISAALGAMLALATASNAQVVPSPDADVHGRSIAAGYKASIYCSAIFNAGRTPADIDRTELVGIYPQYDAIVPKLKAVVDRGRRAVGVSFDQSLPPRWSVWTKERGCTTLPVGSSTPGDRSGLPAATIPGGDPRPWPIGDGGVRPRPGPRLTAAVARAFDGGFGPGSRTLGVLVVDDGRIVAERYAAGFGPFVSNRTWSVGKSIAGTLVGYAGLVDLSGPASVPEWREGDPRRSISMDQLLRMASGLHSDTAGNRTDAIYFGGTTVDEQATSWPLEARPGSRFRYANNDILLAIYSLRHRIGEQRYEALPRTFFGALGMSHTVAETDWHGNFVLSSQVWSTARDLGRLGMFWLQDGIWAGRRLLPEGWMATMRAPSGPQPASGPGYGATLWLFGPEQGLPEGTFAAQGNRGQYIVVVPSRRLVIVRRGEDPGSARFDVAGFAADVLSSIESRH